MVFIDRIDGGRQLAEQLHHLRGTPDVVVVGLPRGGVPVAAEVAAALDAPLDVIVVRKLGLPFQPEVAMGAIGEGGVRVINNELVRSAHVTPEEFAAVEERERAELERRTTRLRRGHSRVALAGKVVVVVDDGIATGSTARAACSVARAAGAARILLAVPVAPADWIIRLAGAADEFVAVHTPAIFGAVGQFFNDFDQTSDESVVQLLRAADARMRAIGRHAPKFAHDVEIGVGSAIVSGNLSVPEAARGLVIFAHGSGSSRHSPRNKYVASVLNQAGLATLLFDLLTADEESLRSNVFDISLLAERLLNVAAWVQHHESLAGLETGYFGASTGAAAALWAAAAPECDVGAVVSRGGRPDLAGPRLGAVRAPTLLIVGGEDSVVLGLNQQAQTQLRCENEVRIVPGASHLFDEPGTLEAVAELARDWFVEYLTAPDRG